MEGDDVMCHHHQMMPHHCRHVLADDGGDVEGCG